MAKIATGIMILREGKSTAWTSDLDTQMTNWTNSYIQWVENAPLALAEKATVKYAASHFSSFWQSLIRLKATMDLTISIN